MRERGARVRDLGIAKRLNVQHVVHHYEHFKALYKTGKITLHDCRRYTWTHVNLTSLSCGAPK